MRRILLLLAIICLASQINAQTYYTKVNTILREGPNTWYKALTSLPKGTSAKVQRSAEDGWVLVISSGRVGYLHSSNLTSIKPVVRKTKVVEEPIEVVDSVVCDDEIYDEEYYDDETSPMSGSEIYKRYNTAVFMVYTKNKDGKIYQGSGFFINGTGLAVSNYHVFEDAESVIIQIPSTKKLYSITKVLARSIQPDYIVFQVDINYSNYIPLASEEPNVGDRVFAIGSPKGYSNTFSSGEISAWRDESLMQISNPIDHGSSGGALINEYGRAVGITSGTLNAFSTANLNYAWSTIGVLRYTRK